MIIVFIQYLCSSSKLLYEHNTSRASKWRSLSIPDTDCVYPESFGCVHNGVEQSLPHPWHYAALNVYLRDMCHSKFVKTTFFIGLFFCFFYTVKYA